MFNVSREALKKNVSFEKGLSLNHQYTPPAPSVHLRIFCHVRLVLDNFTLLAYECVL